MITWLIKKYLKRELESWNYNIFSITSELSYANDLSEEEINSLANSLTYSKKMIESINNVLDLLNKK